MYDMLGISALAIITLYGISHNKDFQRLLSIKKDIKSNVPSIEEDLIFKDLEDIIEDDTACYYITLPWNKKYCVQNASLINCVISLKSYNEDYRGFVNTHSFSYQEGTVGRAKNGVMLYQERKIKPHYPFLIIVWSLFFIGKLIMFGRRKTPVYNLVHKKALCKNVTYLEDTGESTKAGFSKRQVSPHLVLVDSSRTETSNKEDNSERKEKGKIMNPSKPICDSFEATAFCKSGNVCPRLHNYDKFRGDPSFFRAVLRDEILMGQISQIKNSVARLEARMDDISSRVYDVEQALINRGQSFANVKLTPRTQDPLDKASKNKKTSEVPPSMHID